MHRQDVGRVHFPTHRPGLFGIGVRVYIGIVSADGQNGEINLCAMTQRSEGIRIGRIAAEDQRAPPLGNQKSAVAAMLVRQLARAPVVDLEGLNARSIYLHALAPIQFMQLPETSYQIEIAFLDNRLNLPAPQAAP